MTKENIYIVEALDNSLIFLEELLSKNNFNVIGSSNNAVIALSEIKNLPIDLVLLNNNLVGEKDCSWLVQKIRQEINLPTVFLSKNENCEILDNIDNPNENAFLEKPCNFVSLITKINLTINSFKSSKSYDNSYQNQFVIIEQSSQKTKIFIDQINYISSKGNYVTVHLDFEDYVVRSKLSCFMEQMPANNIFKKVHLRFIININKVESFNSNSLIIEENRIPISKTYQNDMNFIFQQLENEIQVF